MIEVIGFVAFWVVVGLFGAALFLWALNRDYKKARARQEQPPEENNEAPYKLESPSASDLVAVSEQPKKRGRPLGSKNKPRKYNKRSPYWTKTKKAKTKKSK